jgi:aminobenzoyl-glutamate utilization protein B
MNSKAYIHDWIERNSKVFEDASDAIWSNPELAMWEFESSKRLADILEENGFAVELGVAGMPTAFVATYGNEGPVIGLSVEYDALANMSQKVTANKEPVTDGAPGHGCGHNLLGTAAVFAAVALKECISQNGLKLRLKVFGTPAEEICVGKPFMGKAGLFSGVDAFLDWHPTEVNKCGCDEISGYFNVKYHFEGLAAHSNSPWKGKSALDGALLAGQAIEYTKEHFPPGPELSANTIHYSFPNDGNISMSILPSRATLWVIGRSLDPNVIKEMMESIDRCADGAALALGLGVTKEFITASNVQLPNEELAQAMYRNLLAIGAPEFTDAEQNFVKEMQRSAGLPESGIHTDILPFSHDVIAVIDSTEYSWNAPSTQLFLSMIPANCLHTWITTACAGSSIGHKTIRKVAEILGATAIDLAENPEILQKAQKEFNERLAGRRYESLIPDGISPPR